jgi:hypothetical protein
MASVEGNHLHLLCPDPFSQVFGGPADHQTTQEHGDQHHQEQSVQATADSAWADLAEHHRRMQHPAADGGEAVVARVRRAIRGRGGCHPE